MSDTLTEDAEAELQLAQQEKETALKNRLLIIEGMRMVADYWENNPDVPVPYSLDFSQHVSHYDWVTIDGERTYADDSKATRKRMKELVRVLKQHGQVNKKYDGSTFTARVSFNSKTTVGYTSSRAAICKKVLTGNKIIHPPYSTPGYVEEEFEWVCTDPLLKADTEAVS